jgi:uncharacterized membrane protein (UPF0127 family)
MSVALSPLLRTTMRNLMVAFVALFAAAACAQQPTDKVVFPTSELTIRTAAGKSFPFSIELALDDPQREYGLMFRKQMDPDHGMLFDFGQPRRVSMWMENTVLPLDMVFIQADGTISHIKENAVPFSRDIIDSRGPVTYVLELNAGRTKALGIKPGDKVIGKPLHNAG